MTFSKFDEAHRSIYGVWRGVLEYFDAHVIGLTATPGKQTFGFFRQNLVSEYTYPESVADGVNVDFDIYRIRTQISEEGSRIEAGTIVPKVDRRTREQRLEILDEDLDYGAALLDRAVTATDQIRTVLETEELSRPVDWGVSGDLRFG
ncbi:DEAD/DEAH box helicase family protein [Mycobacterium avium]|uniref:DEAD/DEAH box helicase family protein n=1 Tax=Mycobacterium avium TaxID=1764 RepID=UPI001EE27C1F|nr:DEAD/DEAH box helicase family protein [Mycobacterium avium]